MSSLIAFLAPLALLLPVAALEVAGGEVRREAPEMAGQPMSAKAPDWAEVSGPLDNRTAQQVRIERRVILRISPAPRPARRNLMAELPRAPLARRMVERRMGKCLEVSGIAGFQAQRGNRLILFMRDQRIIAADLESACSARDFYSGFYLERSEDGQLCVDRDRLLSRTGAKCEVSRLRRIVFEDE